ncbi:MAG: glycoside hydrolase [Gammaproteobacteria bacterium]
MSDRKILRVVLCWHMHQPEYRDLVTGQFHMPWTYLHAIKDYVDMAAHLESCPEARVVVNFVPVLLEQIEDYHHQIVDCLNDGIAIRDDLLAALADPCIPSSDEKRLKLVRDCLRSNRERQIKPYAPYRRLAEFADWLLEHPESIAYINSQFLADLLVWYHLAWMGETVKRGDSRIKRLLDKEKSYTLKDRRDVLEVVAELLGSLIGRWRKLAARGQVELAMSPYAHPILPLLQDFECARQAMPHIRLPHCEAYPGGEMRASWQVRKGREVFQRFFGFAARGCWPSEGAVRDETLKLLGDQGFDWVASGGAVLHNSLPNHSGAEVPRRWQGFRLPASSVTCFFRDDRLSDLIGFEYSKWHADDAVADLVSNLEEIRRAAKPGSISLVPIILDGENAWEHYPENGYYFLHALYQRLARHPDIEMTTFSEYLDGKGPVSEIGSLVAGSWVYGTFSTWLGDPDKNRAWEMLCEVKRTFDRVVSGGRLNESELRRAEQQLAVCEASDWFWWFGDYNPEDAVSSFERQFRMNLANLYTILGEPRPEYLTEVFAHGSGAPPLGGAMRRSSS